MKNLQKYIIFIIPIIYIFFIYDHFISGRPIEYDDGILLDPLLKVHSLKDYFEARKSLQIWDVQPVRDLSYLVDFQLQKFVPAWNVQRSNFFIWICIYLILIKLLNLILSHFNFPPKQNWIIFFSGIFLIHPVLQLGPFWISSRKHILACLFILLATYFFFKIKQLNRPTARESFLVCLFYLLSVLSQPITILIPGIYLLVLVIKFPLKTLFNRNLYLFIFFFTLIFILSMWANYYFYNIVYVKMNSGTIYKYVADNVTQVRLLTFGRFFYQVFDYTMASPIEHDRGSVRNIIGLLSIPIFYYLSIKVLGRNVSIFSLLWFLLPLMVVTLGDVKLFALDTYLITSFVAILILLACFFVRYKFNYFLYLLYIPLLIESHNYSKAFVNGLGIARYANKKEITSFGQYAIATSLLYHGHFDEAFREGYALSKINSNFDHLNHLLPASLYGSVNLSNKTKIRIFKSWPQNYFYTNFFHSLLYPINSKNFHFYQYKALDFIDTAFTIPELRKHIFESLIYIKLHCEEVRKTFCEQKFETAKKRYFTDYEKTNYEFEITTKLTRNSEAKSNILITRNYYQKVNFILFYKNNLCSVFEY